MKKLLPLIRYWVIAAAFTTAFLASCRKDLAEEQPAGDTAAPPSAANAATTANREPSRYPGIYYLPRTDKDPQGEYNNQFRDINLSRRNEAVLSFQPGTSSALRTKTLEYLRNTLFKGLQVSFVLKCICDSNYNSVRGLGVDSVIHNFLINGDPQRAPTTSVQAEVDGPGGTAGLIISKNLILWGARQQTPYYRDKRIQYGAKRGRLRVAVIDTGLDTTARYFADSTLFRFLAPATASRYRAVGITNPALLGKSRFFGWNFIKNNQNIFDDNTWVKHGTNVTGLILWETAREAAGPEIIPLKAFAADGSASLDNILCALSFAARANVHIVNASWGYNGTTELSLRAAIKRLAAKRILVVTAAGNEGHDIGIYPHFPASFSYPGSDLYNLVSTTTATKEGVSPGNNFSSQYVDLSVTGVLGASMLSPFTYTGFTSCTSFATAALTGIVARHYWSISLAGNLKEATINTVLAKVADYPADPGKVRKARRVMQRYP